MTEPQKLQKLIEAIYMFRHEGDLYREEETQRMFYEIMRQPDLL